MSDYPQADVPIRLAPQSLAPNVRWPTHATIAMPPGWATATDELQLLLDEKPVRAQFDPAGRWPDGSIKWLHAHALFEYSAGKPRSYALTRQTRSVPAPGASGLSVRETADDILVENGVIALSVSKKFAGITSVGIGNKTIITGQGGPRLIDDKGILWAARLDADASVSVEVSGPCLVVLKAAGWYQSAELRTQPFARFVTRISIYDNSPLVKIEHSTIFTDDMRKHSVGELGFEFACKPTANTSAADGKVLSGAAGYCQVTDRRLVPIDNPTGGPAGPFGKSNGWFLIQTDGGPFALLAKDFWQKYPKEVSIDADRVTYWQWPKHGELCTADPSDVDLHNVYKLKYLHQGKYLENTLPDAYFEAFKKQTDTTECKAEYARAANLQGVAVHNELALYFVGVDMARPTSQHVDAIQKLYQSSPIALADPDAIAASGALGPVSTRNHPLTKVAVDAMVGYAGSIPRYGDYGQFIYGNTHHDELMRERRPSLHRVWSNNHYQHVSASYRLVALTGDHELLRRARNFLDNYASVGQCRAGDKHDRLDGAGVSQGPPSIKFHNDGAFYHCKGLSPIGIRDYGMDRNDTDAAPWGHWPDPSGLLLGWFVDADRWAKDGWDLWYGAMTAAGWPNKGTSREFNTTLVHMITAQEHAPTAPLLSAIKSLAASLSGTPLVEQRPGPLWEPTWLSRYHEMFPDDAAFRTYLVESAKAVDVMVEGVWSMALSATAFGITKDKSLVSRFLGGLDKISRMLFRDPTGVWNNYGYAPGPARDGHFMLQWHRFLAALVDAQLDAAPWPIESGQYWCGSSRFDNELDTRARGTKILVYYIDEPTKTLRITLNGDSLSGGNIQAASMHVRNSAGSELLTVERLPMSAGVIARQIVRPSSDAVAWEQYDVKTTGTGVYTMQFGATEIGIYSKLTGLPEAQLLRNVRVPDWREDVVYKVGRANGHLLRLTPGKIVVKFTAMGVHDGSRVQLTGKTTLADKWLVSGESLSVTLDAADSFAIDLFSGHNGFLQLTIAADGKSDPLLYAANLADGKFIRGHLAMA